MPSIEIRTNLKLIAVDYLKIFKVNGILDVNHAYRKGKN